MRFLICFLLLVGFSFSLNGTYTDIYQVNQNFTLHWKVADSKLHIALVVNTSGWIGFGIAESSSGSMPGADVLVCWIDANGTQLSDRYTIAKRMPVKDDQQDWTLVASKEENGQTIVEAHRPLNTGDYQDRPILSGVTRVIFAYGLTDVLSYHSSSRRFHGDITFLPPAPELPNDPNQETIQLRMGNYTIPNATSYQCSYAFPVNNLGNVHAIAIDPIITSNLVFDITIYSCSSKTSWVDARLNQRTPQCSLTMTKDTGCNSVFYVWAPGTDIYYLPDNVGFPLGNTANKIQYLIMEIHYENPTGISAVDNSGVEITYTSTLRAQNAGILRIGDIKYTADAIPAGQSCVEYEFSCPGSCTRQFGQTLNIFGSFSHMNRLGKMQWVTVKSAGAPNVSIAERIEFYVWNYQRVNPVNFQIQSNDNLNLHCVYDSSASSNSVAFGPALANEVCQNYLLYWPRLSDSFVNCGYKFDSDTSSGLSVCGISDVLFESNPTMNDPNGGEVFSFGNTTSRVCQLQNIAVLSTTESQSEDDGSNALALALSFLTVIIALFL